MIPIPASILAIENESDRDFMENIFFSYQRLIYHEIGSILNDPWSKDREYTFLHFFLSLSWFSHNICCYFSAPNDGIF